VGVARADGEVLRALSLGGAEGGQGARVSGGAGTGGGRAAALWRGDGAEPLGSGADREPAGGVQGRGAARCRVDPEGAAGGPLRPVPFADHLPDQGPTRSGPRVRGAGTERGLQAEVPELARGRAVSEEQHAVRDRPSAGADREGAAGHRGGGIHRRAGASPGRGGGGRGDHGDGDHARADLDAGRVDGVGGAGAGCGPGRGGRDDSRSEGRGRTGSGAAGRGDAGGRGPG